MYRLSRFSIFVAITLIAVSGLFANQAWADSYARTIAAFENAGESGRFFDHAYGYAVFPTIGKAGFVVGGAYGDGLVYTNDRVIGSTTMTQLSVGWQLGGQAYSMIVFFRDRSAFENFTSGNFEFSAKAEAVAITAGISGAASTAGSSITASGNRENAITAGDYYKGMAVFTIAKGGLMYEATLAGQKFSYTPL